MRYRFHLIPNAHLDPVWLWDWREGLNEGLVTCRTILDLMDEDPELTFIRGEAAVYRHIETFDPPTFQRIRAMVEAGRWDIVGGTVIQPDTNLPCTEVFLRQFLEGSRFFQQRFGRRPTVAWAADSFGHSAGMPDILAAAGMESFAFTRPFAGESSAFWWEGAGGGRVLAWRPPVGWYGSERDEMPRRLDGLLESARGAGFRNVAVLYGVGNHGGGPTRRQQADIRVWAEAHRDAVEIVPSGLHRFFAELKGEIAGKEIPVHRGELNYCLRGCYASVARFKFRYREAERSLFRAETLGSAVAAQLGGEVSPPANAVETLLFNSFHDILPGTSIERAMDDQLAQLGGVLDAARRVELDASNRLAVYADTSVPKPDGDSPGALSFVVMNPEPVAVEGLVAFEGCLDYRPLFAYAGRVDAVPSVLRGPDGKMVPSQVVAVENRFGTASLPWRTRHVAKVSLPALGWGVFTLGLEPDPAVPAEGEVVARAETGIATPRVGVEAAPGTTDVTLTWGDSVRRLRVFTVVDPHGSWGAMDEAPASLDLQEGRKEWTVTATRILEAGPLRARIWVRFAGESSRIDLTLTLEDGSEQIAMEARVLWNQRAARLKLAIESDAAAALYDVPGGVAERPAGSGEVPGGRWVAAGDLVWATDALYCWNLTADGQLQATICRGSRYAADADLPADESLWEPVVDCGELRFSMRIGHGPVDPECVSRPLERPVLVQRVLPNPGPGGRSGALGAWETDGCHLLAFKRAADNDGWIVRWRNPHAATRRPSIGIGSESVDMVVGPGTIATYRLGGQSGTGQAHPCNAREF